MPHVIVKMYPGRSEEQKKALATAIAKDVISTTGCSKTVVSVAIEDVASEDWLESVYKPDIMDHPERLYIKPGYNPFDTSES